MNGCWFNSRSGHIPGWWPPSRLGRMWEANDQCSHTDVLSPSVSPSLPLSLKVNKSNLQQKNTVVFIYTIPFASKLLTQIFTNSCVPFMSSFRQLFSGSLPRTPKSNKPAFPMYSFEALHHSFLFLCYTVSSVVNSEITRTNFFCLSLYPQQLALFSTQDRTYYFPNERMIWCKVLFLHIHPLDSTQVI